MLNKKQPNLSNFPSKENNENSISSDAKAFFCVTTLNNSKQKRYRVNLKAIRLSKGMTQSDVARKTGYTPEFVTMMEHGKYFPILETRIKIAQSLGCDSSAVWEEENE